MKESEVIEAGYVRIRQHVINMIARSGQEQRKLPSVRELGKKFGLSHFTAIKAIKDLVADGFLETKTGIGTFTRPNAHFPQKVKVIAYLLGEGKSVFWGKLSWELISEFGRLLLSKSSKYCFQNHFLSCSINDAAADLISMNYDGIVWISGPPVILKQLELLKKQNIPVISIGGKGKGVSSIGWMFEEERYTITERLLRDGNKKILTIIAQRREEERNGLVRSIRKAHKDYGVPFDEKMIIYEDEHTYQTLSDIIDFGLEPDAIAFTGAISPYYSMLREKLDCENKCTLVSGNLTTYDDMYFSGLMIKRKVHEAMAMAVDNLIEQMEDPEHAPILDEAVEIECVYQKNGEDYV